MKKIERIPPQPGQESVWDYPRPPRLEACNRHVQVVHQEVVIVDTRNSVRVLETSHPPGFYFAPADVRMEFLSLNSEVSFCEFKGKANYYDVRIGEILTPDVAWVYFNPTKGFGDLKDYISFYPGRVDACYVDGEKVSIQEGNFYGGWITSDIVGPFKGGTGTWGW